MFGIHRKAGRLGQRADDEPLQTLFVFLRSGAKQDSNLALQLAYLTRYLCQHLSVAELTAMEMGQNVNLATPLAHRDIVVASLPWEDVKRAAAESVAKASAAPPPASLPPAPPTLRLITVPRHIKR